MLVDGLGGAMGAGRSFARARKLLCRMMLGAGARDETTIEMGDVGLIAQADFEGWG
jgi:hypothetical protein